MSDLRAALDERANAACELCSSPEALDVFEVAVFDDTPQRAVLACEVCRAQLSGDVELDPRHWFCLQESIWSEVPAVAVLSYRTLRRLVAHSWASELLDQAYLADDVLAWAQELDGADDAVKVVDSNGTQLNDGDSVTLIKDLDVKGANFTAKRGTMVKSIRLGDDPGLVEGRVNGTAIFLKTEFLKKA